MVDQGFAQRLALACDGHPHVPPYGQGRQSWIRERMNVSHEAVSRWFAGASRPRPGKIRELAKVLDVDEAWLALGITPGFDSNEDARKRNTQAEGACNTFMGLAQLSGAHVAWPDEKDPRGAFVDFYAVFRGQQVPFNVALADEMAAGIYKLTVPKQYDQCVPIGAFPVGPMAVDFVKLSLPLLSKHAKRKGGYFELIITKSPTGDGYATGADVWPLIVDFTEL